MRCARRREPAPGELSSPPPDFGGGLARGGGFLWLPVLSSPLLRPDFPGPVRCHTAKPRVASPVTADSPPLGTFSTYDGAATMAEDPAGDGGAPPAARRERALSQAEIREAEVLRSRLLAHALSLRQESLVSVDSRRERENFRS